jgi:hypothetical protein
MRLRASPRPIPRIRRAGWVPTNVTFTSVSEIGTSLGAANAQTLPSGSVSGDLIIGVVGNDNPSTTSLAVSTGWTILGSQVQGSNVIKGAVFARVLDGGANDTLTVTGAAQDYVVALTRVPAAHHGVVGASIVADIPIATGATGASGNADPPSLDAGSVKDWLWFVAAVVDHTTGDSISAIPSTYTQLINTKSANSTSSVGVATGWRKIAGSQVQDPGAFANNTQEWIAFTVAVKPAGLPDVIGTLAVTLDNVTSAATGYPVTTGTVAVTLADVTMAAAGNPVITGTVAVTLANTTSAAAGSPVIVGTAAQTLADVTSSAAGSPVIVGTLAVTLADTTMAASGSSGSSVTGTLAVTLDDVTSSASGFPVTTGTVAVTLENTTSSASGSPIIVGTVGVTLDNVTMASSGGGGVSGSLAVTLADTTSSAAGTPVIVGTLAQTLANVTSSASGSPVIVGTAAVTLDAVTSAATGTTVIVGTLAVTLDGVTMTATGLVGIIPPPPLWPQVVQHRRPAPVEFSRPKPVQARRPRPVEGTN